MDTISPFGIVPTTYHLVSYFCNSLLNKDVALLLTSPGHKYGVVVVGWKHVVLAAREKRRKNCE